MITPYAPDRDGLADYSAMLSASLRLGGHDVRVLSAATRGASPPEVIGSVPRTPWRVARTARAVTDLAPDVVHVQFCVAAFSTACPALLLLLRRVAGTGTRVVLTCHDISRDVASLGRLGRYFYRSLAEAATVVVVHTSTARAVVAEVAGPAVSSVVVPHPVPELPPATTQAAELARAFGVTGRRVLLAFGFIHVDKGLADLIRAADLLRRARGTEVDDVCIVVAGAVRRRRGMFRIFELRDALHLRRVRRLIARLGLERVVVFRGYVPRGEIKPWFELAHAAVLPYRRIEESGVANLARRAGTPVVATDVGELAAVASEPDWSCPPRSPASLARSIELCLNARRPELPELGPRAIDDVVASTLALYRANRAIEVTGGTLDALTA